MIFDRRYRNSWAISNFSLIAGFLFFLWTGIPISRLLQGETEKLIHMEDACISAWVGQDEAVRAGSNAVRRSRSGLQDPNRPIGSFIFLGPSGVVKTELARALAEFLFDDEHAMVRIDMSEYIVEIQLRWLAKLLADQGYLLEIIQPARQYLAETGYDPDFGARPLKRTIQRELQNPLALEMLSGKFHQGDKIQVEHGNRGLIFTLH